MIFVKFENGVTIEAKHIKLGEYTAGDDDLDLDPERFTTGELWRNRVVIIPSVELTLVPLGQDKMKAIMSICRNESFEVTFWYPGLEKYYTARFYCSSNYRKPKLKQTLPSLLFEEHTLKLTGMYKMTEALPL